MAIAERELAGDLLAVRVAELYYDDDKTQDEIGSLLGITRWKVGRLLAHARDAGIVRIEIVHPRARRLGLERRLCETFGLTNAVVVPSAPDDEVHSTVARAAADYLAAFRPVPRTIGISWGRTLQDVVSALAPGWATGVTVTQINGGVTLNRRAGTAATTAVTMADKGAGHAVLLPSPAILERADTKRAIESDRTVADVLRAARESSVYLFSAGVADDRSVLLESGYLSSDEVAELARKGAVGDVVGRFIDANGNVVDPSLDERTLGLGHDVLRAAKTAIFVASGSAKHDIARAVVTSGMCTVFITDEDTALDLLEG